MPRAARALVVPALVALAAVAVIGLQGTLTFEYSDYELEVLPAARALAAGDVGRFLELAPIYGGSLVLRAPFGLLPGLWGGGDLAVFRLMAVPALLGAAVLAVWLFARTRARGQAPLAAWTALGLVALNPFALRALEFGHTEELFGAVLAVGAVLAAGGGRPVLSGVLLGAAVANKPWAVLAGLPVLLALGSHRDRAIATSIALAVAGAVMGPLLAAGGRAAAETGAVGFGASTIFQPAQLWWFLGEHAGMVMGANGPKPGFRTPPEWIGLISRAVVVAVPLGLSLAVALRWRGRPWHDALALLALAFLLRCLIDPWNLVYYELPFMLALVAWEVHARRGAPVISLAAVLAGWVTLDVMAGTVPPDLQAACFLAWAVPLTLVLGATVLAPGRLLRRPPAYASEAAC